MKQFVEKVEELKQQVFGAARIVAVSKYATSQSIREAYHCGLRDFGESRIQDAKRKKEELKDLDISWHLVGHLQSNKVKEAIKIFDWIHSVDSLRLAKIINEEINSLDKHCPSPKIFLQVKLVEDNSPNSSGKFGFTVPELLEALPEINGLKNLKVKGLMTILPLGINGRLPPEENFRLFSMLADLQKEIQKMGFPNISLEDLSMGMSNDYPEAIRAGSTMVRVGSFLFG